MHEVENYNSLGSREIGDTMTAHSDSLVTTYLLRRDGLLAGLTKLLNGLGVVS